MENNNKNNRKNIGDNALCRNNGSNYINKKLPFSLNVDALKVSDLVLENNPVYTNESTDYLTVITLDLLESIKAIKDEIKKHGNNEDKYNEAVKERINIFLNHNSKYLLDKFLKQEALTLDDAINGTMELYKNAKAFPTEFSTIITK